MSPSSDLFSEHYRELGDEELLALALQRQQLETGASVALNAELAARSLGKEALRELEDRLRAKVEPEPEAAQDESPPPSELPDDWFNDAPKGVFLHQKQVNERNRDLSPTTPL